MRLAYIPMYSSPRNLATCSTFNHVKLFAKSVVENRDCFLYLVVPDEPGAQELIAKQLTHPRIKCIPVPTAVNQHRELVYMPEVLIKRFSEMEGDLYLDALLTDKPVTVAWLQTLLHTWSTNGMGKITMGVLDRFFLRHNNHAYSPQHFQKSELFNLALADRCYWSTKNVLDDALTMGKNWLAFSELKALRDKSTFAYSPLDLAQMDQFIVPRDAESQQRVVNYAYAFTSGYNGVTNLEVFDYLFTRARQDIKVLVTSPSKGEGVVTIPEQYKEYIELFFRLPQHEFWKKIATAHAFIHMPNYCQLSSSVIEQQYLGLVGIFPDKPWARDMVFPGYPYLAKGKKELLGMLAYVCEHYFAPDVQRVIETQRDFLRARFDGRVNSLKLYDDLHRAVGTGMVGSRGTLPELFAGFFADIPVGGTVSYDEWRKRVKELTRLKLDVADMPRAMQGVSKNRFRRVMLEIGFRDVEDGDLPNFVRERIWTLETEPLPKAGVTPLAADTPPRLPPV